MLGLRSFCTTKKIVCPPSIIRTFHTFASLERIAAVVKRTAAHRIVIGHLAAGVQAARARTRIGAPLIHARLVEIALGTGRAFRTTSGRHSDVVGLTRANRVLVDIAALAVRTARRWYARIRMHQRLDGYQMASHRRVASVARMTATVRPVVGDVTFRIGAAHADAWIEAFLVATGFRLRAVRVHDALGPTFGVWIAIVFRQAGARAGAVALFANGVYAAR